MKNITVAIDDEVYHAARVEAARRRTSVSALVKNFLTRLPNEAEADSETAARNRTMEALLKRTAHFRVGRRPAREELHAR